VATDFESEGLLEGLDGEAREARLKLLRALDEDGVPLDELRKAVEENRLALLPVELELTPGGRRLRFTELADESGLDHDFLRHLIRALGLPLVDDEAFYSEADLEAAKTVRTFREAGIEDEPLLEISRVIGNSLSQIVSAARGIVGETFLTPGDSEYDIAMRFAAAAEGLNPALESVVTNLLRAHQLAQLRQDVMGIAEVLAGRPLGQMKLAVCFADLVGFTRLGEQVASDQLGGVAGRLTALAVDVASPPVRLVKMIGDAAMLVSAEPKPLLDAALDLIDAAEAEGEDFPQLRAGVACGDVLSRAGDYFGRPVNLASRLTDLARPSSVVATAEMREWVDDEGDYSWRRLPGKKRIKGIRGEVDLYRVRRRLPAGQDEAAEVDDVGG
jgi:adenylate cyclase